VRIGFDLSRIANYYISERKVRSYEVMADLRLQNKLLYVAEAGIATIAKERPPTRSSPTATTGGWASTATCSRGATTSCFSGPLRPERLQLPVGPLRDHRTLLGGKPGEQLPEGDFLAQWLEGVAGLKGNVFGNFYLGFTARFKLRVALSGNRNVGAITIPASAPPPNGRPSASTTTCSTRSVKQ
jgi:hypothetical protein